MPMYEYICHGNNRTVEVRHGMTESVSTWGELCRIAGIDPGSTPADSPVEKLVSMPAIATPKTNADLKNLGFTKLVKRDDGVYENVTRTGDEKRYMTRGDASSVPDIRKKIAD
jgi:predicted nucleic acid-binding Zn ribbon protein